MADGERQDLSRWEPAPPSSIRAMAASLGNTTIESSPWKPTSSCGTNRKLGPVRMPLVRSGQHHSVDAFTSDRGEVAGMEARHPVAFARLPLPLRVRIGEGSELDTGQAGQHGDIQPPEAGQASQADPPQRDRGREEKSG